ncbi:MAG: flavodoxin family protein [Desulfomonilaceae bacterium]
MKILNMYFSATGNTEKIANQITKAAEDAGHTVETVNITKDTEVDILGYDFVFIGSGVYTWLPGKPMMEFLNRTREAYGKLGEIKPSSPRRTGKKAVVYCSYGGGHTGVNEALPAAKFMGQLFDHLGYEIISEWFFVGEFHGRLAHLSTAGRLGNIQGRPNEADLRDIYQRTLGILGV